MKTTKWLFVVIVFNFTFAQDGILDYTFDTDGFVKPTYGILESTNLNLKVQPDGKIVTIETVSNHGSHPQYYLRRYLSSGLPDATFGVAGTVVSALVGLDATAKGIELQPDGKIIIGGSLIGIGPGGGAFIARYNANGTVDATFGVSGFAIIVGGHDQSIALQSDGKILIAYSVAAVKKMKRYNSDGTLDAGFGVAGTIALSSVGIIKVLSDGKILYASGNSNFVFKKYLTNGTIDAAFGVGGTVTINIDDHDYLSFVKIQSDGKIVFVGQSIHDATHERAYKLIRLLANGTLDPAFGFAGKVSVFMVPKALDFQNDGKIIVAGTFPLVDSPNILALSRYLPNGNLDMNFGSFGFITTYLGPARVTPQAVQFSNGKIITGGFFCEAYLSCHPHSFVARYNTIIVP